ncbi:MAG: hypothetical protein QOF67_1212 [Mycobacterium sp.]|jgi:hypothetical protein|nr:hypothetical protein [Mycobacterium sp.]
MTTSSLDADPTSGQLAAAGLMMTTAILTFVIGVFALAANHLVVSGPGYEYTFQVTGWGWANIVTGMVLAAVSVAVFVNAQWARAAAIVVTCLAIVVTFLWMPYYPTGSIVLIALDVVVIWGVATWSTSRTTA